MIYLIKSSGYSKDKQSYIDLLKIGYTEDSNMDKRLSQYKLHNPTCEVLYIIPMADELDERGLHLYFKDLRYSEYGREWYKFDQRIIDFFESHLTKDSISSFSDIVPPTTREIVREVNRTVSELYNKGEVVITEIVKKYTEIIKSIRSDIKPINYKSMLDHLESTYKVDLYKDTILSSDAEDFMKEFDAMNTFTDKMRYLSRYYKGITDENLKLEILTEIPVVYKFYIVLLGPERILQLGGQRSKLEKEYQKVKLNSNCTNQLREAIYSTFEVDKRYVRADIKDTLTDIYEKVGINAAPKASDLESYFEIKPCTINDKVTGKRINGYEILSIKEDDKE